VKVSHGPAAVREKSLPAVIHWQEGCREGAGNKEARVRRPAYTKVLPRGKGP